jgi:FkbM family methyltransferase
VLARRVDLFAGTSLGPAIGDHPVVAIDVGSRGGFEPDLDPIAWSVDAIGFEPDPVELARLERIVATQRQPWRSIRHVPAALSGRSGHRNLHIPITPDSASLLEHDPSVGERFGKPAMFTVDRIVDVDTMTIDEAIARFELPPPHYLKLDIEGAELEVLASGEKALTSTLALKTEVSFIPMRRQQPLATDVDVFLRDRGFHLVDFIRAVHWRRNSYVPHPHLTRGRIPYSRGEIAHGDYLYFREPDTIPTDDAPLSLRAAVLAMTHGFFDYASALLERPSVSRYLSERYRLNSRDALEDVSLHFGRRVWAQSFSEHLKLIVTFLRSVPVAARH